MHARKPHLSSVCTQRLREIMSRDLPPVTAHLGTAKARTQQRCTAVTNVAKIVTVTNTEWLGTQLRRLLK